MSLSKSVLLFTFCALVSLFEQGRLFAQSSPPIFVKVNPAGTYLAVDSCDQGTLPTSVTLSSLGIVPGIFVRLTQVGAFQWGQNFNDDGTTLGAVFSGPGGLISPGPDGQHLPFISGPTACNNLANDILDDFNVEFGTVVQLPVGATHILFTTNDSFWSDNTDPNGDFGVSLEFGTSWPILVTTTANSGGGSLREAIAVANNDPAPNSITFDPNVFPLITPCASPLLPLPPLPHAFVSRAPVVAAAAPGTIFLTSQLPTITGTGDSVDGTGSCVVIDGRNLPNAMGLTIRARDFTLQGLTIQNFIGNDAVRVEARNNTPDVTGVVIAGNNFYMDRRAVHVNGGTTNQPQKIGRFKVDATVIGNTIQDVESGIAVVGNIDGDPAPGNDVTADIGNNLVQATFTRSAGRRGDGINVLGATGDKSDNSITASIYDNTVKDVIDDGIAAGACGQDDTGYDNSVDVRIEGNTLQHFRAGNIEPPSGIVNNGIIVYGSGGESAAVSACVNNTVRFLVARNEVTNVDIRSNQFSGNDDGIFISSGPSGSSTNGFAGNINISFNNSTRNNRDGIRVSGGDPSGSVLLTGIVTNNFSQNGRDGIGISSNANGTGNTAVTGNACLHNGKTASTLIPTVTASPTISAAETPSTASMPREQVSVEI